MSENITHTYTYTRKPLSLHFPSSTPAHLIAQNDDCLYGFHSGWYSYQTCSLISLIMMQQALCSTRQTLNSNSMTHKSSSRTTPAGKQQHELIVIIMWKPHAQMCVSRADRSTDVSAPCNSFSEKSNRGWRTIVIMAHCGLQQGKSDSWMSLASVLIILWWDIVCGMSCQFLSLWNLKLQLIIFLSIIYIVFLQHCF